MGSILVMENFQAHFPSLTGADLQGWLVASLELGAWAGALFNGYLADRISRKYSMLVAVIIFTLGTGLQVGAQNPGYLFAGRTIGGWGIGMFSMVIPLYQAEIAPPRIERLSGLFATTFHHYRNLHLILARVSCAAISIKTYADMRPATDFTSSVAQTAMPHWHPMVAMIVLVHLMVPWPMATLVWARRLSLGVCLWLYSSFQPGSCSLECSFFHSLHDGL